MKETQEDRTTLETLYRSGRALLEQAGVETPALDARLLIRQAAGVEEADLIASPERPVPPEQAVIFQTAIRRRADGEPVSRILGQREFWGLPFRVTPETLDPRPDTETLVEAVLGRMKKQAQGREGIRILDLGTGTGCILIALLSELPEACGVGIDLNPGAVRVAEENAQANGVAGRVSFLCGNWFEPLANLSGDGTRFDLIVSNPPYIPNPDIESLQKEVKNHDPILALDGGKDGLDPYRRIFMGIKNHLKPDGQVFFEIGFGQHSDILRLVDDSDLRPSRTYPDSAGIPRVVEISDGENSKKN